MEIRDTELNRFEPVGTHTLLKANENLTEALDICNKFASLEKKFSQVCKCYVYDILPVRLSDCILTS